MYEKVKKGRRGTKGKKKPKKEKDEAPGRDIGSVYPFFHNGAVWSTSMSILCLGLFLILSQGLCPVLVLSA